MRHFKLKQFQRWFKKNKLTDSELLALIDDIEQSKSSVKLGENLYKVRIAYGSKGKSGGYRTIIAYKQGKRTIFLVGFAKNERANISKLELRNLKDFAKVYLSLSDEQIQIAVDTSLLIELEAENHE
jgi:hypothetical protein